MSSARQRVAQMTPEDKADLLCRFRLYIVDNGDNRRARLTMQEAELLEAIASEP